MINGEIKNLPLSFGHQIEFYKKLMTGLNVTSWFLKFLSYDIDPDWKRKSIQILPFFIFSQKSRHQEETEREEITLRFLLTSVPLLQRAIRSWRMNQSNKMRNVNKLYFWPVRWKLSLLVFYVALSALSVLTCQRLVHLLEEDQAEVLSLLWSGGVSREVHLGCNTW